MGSLLYLATQTRPDIAFAIDVLARHVYAPTKATMPSAKNELRYLVCTKRMGLQFGGKGSSMALGMHVICWGCGHA